MMLDRFFTEVERSLAGGWREHTLAVDEAARTGHAALVALGRSLDDAERQGLAARLPAPLRRDLIAYRGPPRHEDTVALLASRLEVPREVAARRMACVLLALRECFGVTVPTRMESLTVGC
jgi:hypothetical protein